MVAVVMKQSLCFYFYCLWSPEYDYSILWVELDWIEYPKQSNLWVNKEEIKEREREKEKEQIRKEKKYSENAQIDWWGGLRVRKLHLLALLLLSYSSLILCLTLPLSLPQSLSLPLSLPILRSFIIRFHSFHFLFFIHNSLFIFLFYFKESFLFVI